MAEADSTPVDSVVTAVISIPAAGSTADLTAASALGFAATRRSIVPREVSREDSPEDFRRLIEAVSAATTTVVRSAENITAVGDSKVAISIRPRPRGCVLSKGFGRALPRSFDQKSVRVGDQMSMQKFDRGFPADPRCEGGDMSVTGQFEDVAGRADLFGGRLH